VPPRRLLVGQEADLAAAYEAGATVQELAASIGCSVTTVRDVLADAGVALRARGPRSPLEGQEASLAAAYLGGATVRDLVERFGANQRTIRKVLAEQGVEMRRPGRKPA
jgi:DeoR/GlpR family transcriptional regulator of sugar metabolism